MEHKTSQIVQHYRIVCKWPCKTYSSEVFTQVNKILKALAHCMNTFAWLPKREHTEINSYPAGSHDLSPSFKIKGNLGLHMRIWLVSWHFFEPVLYILILGIRNLPHTLTQHNGLDVENYCIHNLREVKIFQLYL